MMGVALPKREMIIALIGMTLVSAAVTWNTISEYRYATWPVINRSLPESLILPLIYCVLSSAVISRKDLKPTLPWLSASQSRATAMLLRSSLAIACTLSAGLLIGWLPIIFWGITTARGGFVSLLVVTSSCLWIFSASLFTILFTVATQSIWPSIAISLIWPVLFEVGRSWNVAYVAPYTNIPLFPYDGVYISISGTLEMRNNLLLLHILGALFVTAASLWGIHKYRGQEDRKTGSVKMLFTVPMAMLISVFSVGSLHSITIMSSEDHKTICSNDKMQTCVYDFHAKDLSLASSVASRFKSNLPGLFTASKVTEDSRENSVGLAHISLITDKDDNPLKDLSQQLSTSIASSDACFSSHNPNPDSAATEQVLDNWFAYAGSGSSEILSGLDPTSAKIIDRWRTHAKQVNKQLLSKINEIKSCTIKSSELPK